MLIKQILVLIQHRASADSIIRMAVVLAERFEATIVGTYVIPPGDVPLYASGRTLSAVMNEMAARDQQQIEQVRASLESLARRHGIATEWRVAPGSPNEQAVVQARYSDLVVLSQDGSARLRDCEPLSPQGIVRGISCPMMVVPRRADFSPALNRAVVAWNASKEAKRAVDDALSILATVETVHIVVVNPGRGHEGTGGHGAEPGADIARHLTRHGIRPEIHVDLAPEQSVGARLLEWTERLHADLLVAGAYGRSRLRESLVGGVTQHLLQHTHVPILMSR